MTIVSTPIAVARRPPWNIRRTTPQRGPGAIGSAKRGLGTAGSAGLAPLTSAHVAALPFKAMFHPDLAYDW